MAHFIQNKDLSKLNTFGLKAKADYYYEYDNVTDLSQLQWASLKYPVLHLGSGSNILFTKDFHGTVMRSRIKGIEPIGEMEGSELLVRVGAGELMDDFCHWAARKNLWGPENLSAIPGTVGASVVQNIGAYGVEAGDIVSSITVFNTFTSELETIKAEDAQFGYRDSIFKHKIGIYVVLYVVFKLYSDFRPRLDYGHLKEEVERNVELSKTVADPYNPLFGPLSGPQLPLTPMLVRDTVKAIRESKLPNPDKIGNAGSFFKNPVVSSKDFSKIQELVTKEKGGNVKVPHFDLEDGKVKIPAAFLIEYCGFKGKTIGGAAVWEKQPLVIVNAKGKASAQDILQLEKEIINAVRDKFEIVLHPEVIHV